MAARPLPGASYHTADFAFHSSPDVDPEAVHSYPSEKEPSTPEKPIRLPLQTSQGRRRPRRGQLVLLIVLLFFCLAFVVSAFGGRRRGFDVDFQCETDRAATLAYEFYSLFGSTPHKELLYERRARAIDILEQKYNSSRVGCHATNVRDYVWQSYPAVHSSLQWTNVSHSAIVLHWQGADPKLKPVLIGNNLNVTDIDVEDLGDLDLEDVADVESAVAMLTAVDALIQSGYQPSRTLVLSPMLGEAADAREVHDYLHSTYDEQGLDMGLTVGRMCEGRRLSCAISFLFHRLYWTVTDLFPILFPRCAMAQQFDDDTPRFFRHLTNPAIPAVAGPRATTIGIWTLTIVRAGTES